MKKIIALNLALVLCLVGGFSAFAAVNLPMGTSNIANTDRYSFTPSQSGWYTFQVLNSGIAASAGSLVVYQTVTAGSGTASGGSLNQYEIKVEAPGAPGIYKLTAGKTYDVTYNAENYDTAFSVARADTVYTLAPGQAFPGYACLFKVSASGYYRLNYVYDLNYKLLTPLSNNYIYLDRAETYIYSRHSSNYYPTLSTRAGYENGFVYELKDGTATVAGCDLSSTTVEIPATLGGAPVTAIADRCFANSDLRSVTVPDSVTAIGQEAFYNCASLWTINLPDHGLRIGRDAFLGSRYMDYNYTAAGSVYIDKHLIRYNGDGIKAGTYSIADWAAAGRAFTDVALPVSMTHVGECAFFGCSYLTSLAVYGDLEYLGVQAFSGVPFVQNEENYEDGVLYLGSYLYASTVACPSDYTVKEGTKRIGRESFASNASLVILRLPEGVEVVEDDAFALSENLTHINIPSTLREIGDEAFGCCAALEQIILPATVTQMGNDVFADCDSVTVYGYENSAAAKVQEEGTRFVALSKPVPTLQIIGTPQQTTYQVGEKPDLNGLRLLADYGNGVQPDVTVFAQAALDTATIGTKLMTFSYGGATAAFSVHVVDGESTLQ
ncbi:MAG: leucine-rich repeat protein, partial [Clostridia bacterium]|nr:leucine-rich repeat protein [Clostridia bacterium]